MVIDALAAASGVAVARRQGGALVAIAPFDSTRVVLAKPQTYMNLSGRAVRQLLKWYELDPAALLVVFDDMDLPLGKVRVRERGGAGGHRGIESIIQHLGTQEIPRIRVGIGRPSGEPPEEYVLTDFSQQERTVIAEAIQKAVEAVRTVLSEGMAAAMTRMN